MPLGTDPTETLTWSLQADQKLPEADRPKYTSRFLTPRKMREASRLLKESGDAAAKDMPKAETLALDALKVGLVGWENVKDDAGAAIPFTWENLADTLSFYERLLVGHAMVRATDLREADFFVSALRAGSLVAESADAATAANA